MHGCCAPTSIRATWCKASEFRKALFPPDLAKDLEQPTYGFSFSIGGFFDGLQVPQAALIGVYETCSAEGGSFLLIIARPPGKPPTIQFVSEFFGLGFGILAIMPDATIHVAHCLECDHITEFKWNKTKKHFVRLEPLDYA